MKKFALMMALALPLAFASCGDDNDDATLTLDQTSVDVAYGNTATLKASEKGANWGSSNEFVCTVDNDGKITAKHVGTATVSATKNGSTAKCTVNVLAVNNNFNLPYLNWGATVADVKASDAVKGLNLLTEVATGLTYTQSGLAYPWYLYVFENDALRGSMIAVDEQMDVDKDLQGFLEERYQLVEEDELTYTYVNANTIGQASLAVVYGYDVELESVTATWMVPSDVATKGIAFKNAPVIADLKQMLKEAKNK